MFAEGVVGGVVGGAAGGSAPKRMQPERGQTRNETLKREQLRRELERLLSDESAVPRSQVPSVSVLPRNESAKRVNAPQNNGLLPGSAKARKRRPKLMHVQSKPTRKGSRKSAAPSAQRDPARQRKRPSMLPKSGPK